MPGNVRIHKTSSVTPRWDRDCFCPACKCNLKIVCIKQKRCDCCTYVVRIDTPAEAKRVQKTQPEPDPRTLIQCTCPICNHGEKAVCLRLKCRCCVTVRLYRDEHR